MTLPLDNPEAYGARIYRTRAGELRQEIPCTRCDGRGSWRERVTMDGRRRLTTVPCEACNATGRLWEPVP